MNTNQRLSRAAPHLTEKTAAWRVDYGMTAGNVKIIVSSVESELRGVRHGAERPTLILCDDIETEKNTRNQQGREKFQKDFMKEISHLGCPTTNIVLCGTVLNPRSFLGLIFSKKKYHDWIPLKYSAVLLKSQAVDLWARWKLIFRGAEDFNAETGPKAARNYGGGEMFDEDKHKVMRQFIEGGSYTSTLETQLVDSGILEARLIRNLCRAHNNQ
ncbi:MAG: hypothetical protein HQL22_10335 [Candidatus Omnitrophica bacterium]|nr:hypothetical protein [Candidatus Omnitrophota bacterium]